MKNSKKHCTRYLRKNTVILLFTLFLMMSGNILTNTASAGNSPDLLLNPSIEFTSVPIYGSFLPLQGKVHNVNPANWKIAVILQLEGYGYANKPSWANPLTVIQNDSTWSCNVTTGGSDQFANFYCVFLLPIGLNPPQLAGNPEIPDSMFTNYIHLYTIRYRRTLSFAGYNWWVKNTILSAGPGPNNFSDSTQNVWVNNGELHMKITNRNGIWYCPEVICKDTFNYGRYVFKVASPVGMLDRNIVCGLFTYDMSPLEAHREIDIEFSRWGIIQDTNAQYVIQPFNLPGYRHRWIIPGWVTNSSHIFEWKPDTIKFMSVRGYNVNPPYDTIYHSWTFSGSGVPHHNKENARINLWLYNSIPPSNGQEAEIVIHDFTYSNLSTNIRNNLIKLEDESYRLHQNYPNPFNPSTNIRYSIPKSTYVKLVVFDMLGREVEILVNEKLSPGTYEVNWNASNYPSGVYLYKITTDDFTETKIMNLIK